MCQQVWSVTLDSTTSAAEPIRSAAENMLHTIVTGIACQRLQGFACMQPYCHFILLQPLQYHGLRWQIHRFVLFPGKQDCCRLLNCSSHLCQGRW